jgi:hypothetical protein
LLDPPIGTPDWKTRSFEAERFSLIRTIDFVIATPAKAGEAIQSGWARRPWIASSLRSSQ